MQSLAEHSPRGQNPKENMAAGGTDLEEQKLRKWFLGSIDQGTTSTRFLIFDGTGAPVASHQIEFKQMHPQSGYRRCFPESGLIGGVC